jgi:hypothetical protein
MSGKQSKSLSNGTNGSRPRAKAKTSSQSTQDTRDRVSIIVDRSDGGFTLLLAFKKQANAQKHVREVLKPMRPYGKYTIETLPLIDTRKKDDEALAHDFDNVYARQ